MSERTLEDLFAKIEQDARDAHVRDQNLHSRLDEIDRKQNDASENFIRLSTRVQEHDALINGYDNRLRRNSDRARGAMQSATETELAQASFEGAVRAHITKSDEKSVELEKKLESGLAVVAKTNTQQTSSIHIVGLAIPIIVALITALGVVSSAYIAHPPQPQHQEAPKWNPSSP